MAGDQARSTRGPWRTLLVLAGALGAAVVAASLLCCGLGRWSLQEHRELLASAPEALEETRSELARVDALLAEGNVEGAKGALWFIENRLEPFQRLSTRPEAGGLALQLAAERRAYLTAQEALQAPLPEPPGPYLQRQSALKDALTTMEGFSEPFRSHAMVQGLRSEIERELRKIAPQAAKESKALDKLLAMAERCGEKPGWSFHGGLVIVDLYMQQTAHDPSSIQSEQCTDPEMTDRCWRSTCLVRGRNAFGALVANQYTFYIGADSISVE